MRLSNTHFLTSYLILFLFSEAKLSVCKIQFWKNARLIIANVSVCGQNLNTEFSLIIFSIFAGSGTSYRIRSCLFLTFLNEFKRWLSEYLHRSPRMPLCQCQTEYRTSVRRTAFLRLFLHHGYVMSTS